MTRRTFTATAAATALGAPQGKRPNILFFFPDQLRFDWTGANKSVDVRTPNLNALAARGVNFRRAVVASPLCAPSRACLASGREYERCGVRNNGQDYPVEQRTFYTLLREAGYHTMACGKVDLHKKTQDWGLDGRRMTREWGYSDAIDNAGKHDAINSGARTPKDPYMAYLHASGLAATHVEDFHERGRKGNYAHTAPTPLPEDAYCDNYIARNGLALLDRAPRDKPWFLMLNFTGPHSPMDITRRMDGLCRGREYPQPNGNRQFDARTHTAIRQNYSAMVENIDAWLGIFLHRLKQRGELDNTLVVFCSDHGEMLGDHNRWGKSVPYQASIGVPLVVAGPGVRRGHSTDALVSHIDLASTFLDWAGVPTPGDMDSRSLRPVLAGATDRHRSHVRSGLDDWRTVWDGRYKLTRGFAQSGLFDLARDPGENEDISAREPATVARLEKLLSGSPPRPGASAQGE